jgi:DNA polymerase III alpha subunit
MKIDALGLPKYGVEDCMDLIYKGKLDTLFKVYVEKNSETEQFNQSIKETGDGQMLKFYESLDIDLKDFDNLLQSEWFMPNSYKQFDIEKFLMAQCPDNAEAKTRVTEELDKFKELGHMNLLKFLHFLVTFMKENKIVWGVGRGSSVASYVLYLLGIHKIDSIQYRLDWKEFIR